MRIIMVCSCGAESKSYQDWDSVQQFLSTHLDEPEFEHEEFDYMCPGTKSYYREDEL